MLTDFDWAGATASPIFLVLIACSAVTLGVILERVFYYYKRRGNPDAMAREIIAHLRSGNVGEALRACRAGSHPLGAVAQALFENGKAVLDTAEERIQVALSQQKLLLQRNLSVLGTMAAIAPLIGLLGTVWGIMRAFHDMARVGSAAPSVVAAGVAEALVTTAAGLIVAVPALILYNHFAGRMNVALTEAENHARAIRNCMAEYSTTDAAPQAHTRSAATQEAPEPAPVGAR